MGGCIARARRHVGVLLVATAIPLSGCQNGPGDTPSPGTSIQVIAIDTAGIVTLPPGARITLLIVPVKNISTTPLTLEGIQMAGPGLGEVVRIIHTSAVPDGRGIHGFPSGVFTTYPPVFEIDGECHTPEVVRLEGVTLAPGERVRVLYLVEAEREGAYASSRQMLTYRQEGELFRQEITSYFRGRVSTSAPEPKHDPAEAPCIKS